MLPILEEALPWIEPATACIRPYEHLIAGESSKPNIRLNNFLLLLRREIISDSGADVKAVLELVSNRMVEFEVRPASVRILNGAYLRNLSIIEAMYKRLTEVSIYGPQVLRHETLTAINQTYGVWIEKGATIIGAQQFLDVFPRCSAYELFQLSQPWKKIQSGVYVSIVEYERELHLVLNGIQPYQLEQFHEDGSAVVAIECFSPKDWKVLRHFFGGGFPVETAQPLSLRRTLFERCVDFGIKVGGFRTGVHMSAGSLEGMREIALLFGISDHAANVYDKTQLGQLLAKARFSIEQIVKLVQDPLVIYLPLNRHVSAFELTEEWNQSTALALLKNCLID